MMLADKNTTKNSGIGIVTSPIKRSQSVTNIIHGGDLQPTNHYYVDSLERFKRDHATVDRQEREQKRQRTQDVIDRKRIQTIERQIGIKKNQDDNLQKMITRQAYSQILHQQGSQLNCHSHGVPIDPVNLKYKESERGRFQQHLDTEKQINTFVRAHHIQTCGNSGYNIINGQSMYSVEQMVQNQNYPRFEEKLVKYYERFKINPNPV